VRTFISPLADQTKATPTTLYANRHDLRPVTSITACHDDQPSEPVISPSSVHHAKNILLINAYTETTSGQTRQKPAQSFPV